MVRFVGLTMGMLVPGMRRPCLDGDESTIAGKSHRWNPDHTSRERATGIEPAFSAWEADVLPLNYARECSSHYPLPRT